MILKFRILYLILQLIIFLFGLRKAKVSPEWRSNILKTMPQMLL